MGRRILVTGASVAGNAAAWWLGRHGFDVTVVEREPAFRDGGQNVDVRGAGREVLRRMGLEAAALACGTGEEGTAWVDGAGAIVARFAAGTGDDEGMTAEMEILRGDLARLLHEPARERARFRFGDRVAAIDQDEAAAIVTFAGGTVERYDAVIVAEGVGSQTRERVFPGENRPRPMDLAVAFFTIPRTAGDDRLWRWYVPGGSRSVSLRPDDHGTTRAMLMLQRPPDALESWGVERQRAFLRERFADVGWEAARVLAGMDGTDDFYLDVLRQVRMPRWSKGRVVLTGDAAWCVTPLGGVGATLSVVGAYVLAGELARTQDTAAAFAAYERLMRPRVDRGQSVSKLAPRLMHPRSRFGVRLQRGALRLASDPRIIALAGKAFGRRGPEPELPRYEAAPA